MPAGYAKQDVLAFVRVVEGGSFAKAAIRMGLSKPVISRLAIVRNASGPTSSASSGP